MEKYKSEVYKIPPRDFSPGVEVAACYVGCGDTYLFLQSAAKKSQGGTWGVPAGKLEVGETPVQAVIRETKEEAGLSLINHQLRELGPLYIRYPQLDFVYHMFSHKYSDLPEITLSDEHQNSQWVTAQAALQLPLISGAAEALHHFLVLRNPT